MQNDNNQILIKKFAKLDLKYQEFVMETIDHLVELQGKESNKNEKKVNKEACFK